MKRIGLLLFPMLVILMMLGGNAFAAVAPEYFTTYYSSANAAGAPDATLRIINDGNAGIDLWAAIYVFDDSEELQECCACDVTIDGLLSESVTQNLTANPLTGLKPKRGVVKVVSSDNGDPTNPNYVPGLREWFTHVQGTKVTLSPGKAVVPAVAGPFFVTETLAAESNLSASELTLLADLCFYDTLLSGQPCTCNQEDFDF